MITGQVLIDHIIKIFEEYGLTETEVKEHVIFISDRGANIKYGLIKGGFVRLTCYAHLVHNLVTHFLEEPRVHEIMKQCTKLSSYVKNSGLNKQLKTSLKVYSATRWHSLLTMVDAIIESYEHVYELLIVKQRLMNEAKLKNNQQPDNNLSELVTVLNVTELNEIRDLLKPFKVR